MSLMVSDNIIIALHQAFIYVIQVLLNNFLHLLATKYIILARKRIKTANSILNMKKKKNQEIALYNNGNNNRSFESTSQCTYNNSAPILYPYQQNYHYPITMDDWYVHPPQLHIPPNIPPLVLAPNINPMLGPPIFSPILPPTVLTCPPGCFYSPNEFQYTTQPIATASIMPPEQIYVTPQTHPVVLNTIATNPYTHGPNFRTDSLEDYLRLPKELFPSSKMLALDPNPIIDEFCKEPNVLEHLPWLLDLELGLPKCLKSPIIRPIPLYNVHFNSIHCKNAPNAIHPGFESCSPDFKRALLFYYDCIVSAWYKGYMIISNDGSVENFQSWLQLPMQRCGMAWA